MEQILARIRDERERQDAKWGEQNHDLPVWVTVLTEEVGEFAMAVLDYRAGSDTTDHIREELVQIAAVAVATVQYLDRHDL